MNPAQQIGIIGGGITGLAAAWQLQQRLPSARIVVMDATDRLGGFLQTEQVDGYLIDTSADMFTTEPSTALELCQELGRTDELISTQPVSQRAYIATPSGIGPVPKGFSLMLPNDLDAVRETQLLDEAGKQRFFQEETVPPNESDLDESLESFATRRFGRQVFERLIQPLVSGIYTADPKKLSMQATLSRFIEMEQQFGSLIAAGKNSSARLTSDQAINADQTASGARYDLFRAPAKGMGQLIDWIAQALRQVEIWRNCEIREIAKSATGWQLTSVNSEVHSFDQVIVATPSTIAARLLQRLDSNLADELTAIERASCAIVVFGLDKNQLQQNFTGYGIVVPSCLNRQLIAASFSSNKFAGRAPSGKMLIRCFVGGALQGELVDLPDRELIRLVYDELNRVMPLAGEPELTRVYRWKQAMPQYHIDHLQRVRRIEKMAEVHQGLEITGNSYRGVGIPVCVDCGRSAADRIVKHVTEAGS